MKNRKTERYKMTEMISLNNHTMILSSQDKVSARGNLQIITTLNIMKIILNRRIIIKKIMKAIMNSIKRKRRHTTRKLPFRNYSTKMTKKKMSREM